ncbi:MAG: YraN family protein [Deltaproteobacteria bacterium]|nr:YraN family protein [Deltaproteobacteria bacterium]
MTASHQAQAIGRKAESYVKDCLEKAGWTIVARNYRGRSFELDLVMIDQKNLVVVEVKYRKSTSVISELLPQSKKNALKTGVRHFLSSHYRNRAGPDSIRLDLALVSGLPPQFFCHYFTDAAELS